MSIYFDSSMSLPSDDEDDDGDEDEDTEADEEAEEEIDAEGKAETKEPAGNEVEDGDVEMTDYHGEADEVKEAPTQESAETTKVLPLRPLTS